MNEQFIDLVEIDVESGRGGDGKVGWRREKFEPMGGPAGGDGGRGGSVILKADHNLNTLLNFRFQKKFKAANGENGGSSRKTGASAEDLFISVPVGTVVYKKKDKEENENNSESENNEIEEYSVVGDLNEDGLELVVARGGKGGKGNCHFAMSTRQAPHICEPGEASQRFKLKLELKLVADVGIIGLPNAGKSTLISRLSACKPKIGNYPFTTIIPNLGIMELNDGKSITIADIPGLIEGASEGVGLGFHFLRHIERTALLLHVIDSLQTDENILKNYKIVIDELEKYNPEILSKKSVLVFNKTDSLQNPDEFKNLIKNLFKKKHEEENILFISAVTGDGIESLRAKLSELDFSLIRQKILDLESINVAESDLNKLNKHESERKIKIDFDQETRAFRIKSSFVEGLVRVTNFTNIESVAHLYSELSRLKVIEQLNALGIQSGDTVMVGNREMIWSEHADSRLI